MSEPFIGEIRMWACNYAPRGWAFCRGGLLPINENTALYAVIGILYGGDGRNTLGLPNLQGRAPMHWGQGSGLKIRNIGEKSGLAAVSLNQEQMPSHDHILKGVKQVGSASQPNSNLMMGFDSGATENIVYLVANTTANATLANSALGFAGNSQSHENRQPSLAVNFCIALVGLFPSRN